MPVDFSYPCQAQKKLLYGRLHEISSKTEKEKLSDLPNENRGVWKLWHLFSPAYESEHVRNVKKQLTFLETLALVKTRVLLF